MSKVDFYRVAHPSDKTGPYQRFGVTGPSSRVTLARKLCDAHGWTDGAHPPPRDDTGLYYIGRYEHCGFQSIEQLNQWFAGWMAALNETGFKLYHYKIPAEDVRHGERQSVAVLPKRAYRVKDLV